MTSFVQGKPVSTTTPSVVVDAGLPLGKHLFTLEVEDDEGNRSNRARAVVVVIEPVPAPPG